MDADATGPDFDHQIQREVDDQVNSQMPKPTDIAPEFLQQDSGFEDNSSASLWPSGAHLNPYLTPTPSYTLLSDALPSIPDLERKNPLDPTIGLPGDMLPAGTFNSNPDSTTKGRLQPSTKGNKIEPDSHITTTPHFSYNQKAEAPIGVVLSDTRKFKCTIPACKDLTFGQWADLQIHYTQQHNRAMQRKFIKRKKYKISEKIKRPPRQTMRDATLAAPSPSAIQMKTIHSQQEHPDQIPVGSQSFSKREEVNSGISAQVIAHSPVGSGDDDNRVSESPSEEYLQDLNTQTKNGSNHDRDSPQFLSFTNSTTPSPLERGLMRPKSLGNTAQEHQSSEFSERSENLEHANYEDYHRLTSNIPAEGLQEHLFYEAAEEVPNLVSHEQSNSSDFDSTSDHFEPSSGISNVGAQPECDTAKTSPQSSSSSTVREIENTQESLHTSLRRGFLRGVSRGLQAVLYRTLSKEYLKASSNIHTRGEGSEVTGTRNDPQGSTSEGKQGNGKRKRNEDNPRSREREGENSDDDQDETPRRRVRASVGDQGRSQRRLKCPYYQRRPDEHTRAACRGEGFMDMAKLKDHLKRVHTRPLQCMRCWQNMANTTARDHHLQQDPICIVIPEPADDRISAQRLQELNFNGGSFGQAKTIEEKWRILFRVLFPAEEHVPSAYEISGMSTQFEKVFTKILEEELSKELGPALSRIEGRLYDIIQRCKELTDQASRGRHSSRSPVTDFIQESTALTDASKLISSPPRYEGVECFQGIPDWQMLFEGLPQDVDEAINPGNDNLDSLLDHILRRPFLDNDSTQ